MERCLDMSKQKMTKRKVQANKTKKKIFNVSIGLMEKRGFNNMTIEDICKKAGVSVGTFYHYYKSKEDVFFELYRKSDAFFKDEVAPFLENENLNTSDKVVLYFKYYARYNSDKDLEYVRQLYNTNNKFFIDESRYMIVLLIEIIAKGQEINEIARDMSARDIAIYLFIVSRGIVFDWCIHEAGYDLEEKMSMFFKKIMIIFKK